jgi:hypothetical protein
MTPWPRQGGGNWLSLSVVDTFKSVLVDPLKQLVHLRLVAWGLSMSGRFFSEYAAFLRRVLHNRLPWKMGLGIYKRFFPRMPKQKKKKKSQKSPFGKQFSPTNRFSQYQRWPTPRRSDLQYVWGPTAISSSLRSTCHGTFSSGTRFAMNVCIGICPPA